MLVEVLSQPKGRCIASLVVAAGRPPCWICDDVEVSFLLGSIFNGEAFVVEATRPCLPCHEPLATRQQATRAKTCRGSSLAQASAAQTLVPLSNHGDLRGSLGSWNREHVFFCGLWRDSFLGYFNVSMLVNCLIHPIQWMNHG